MFSISTGYIVGFLKMIRFWWFYDRTLGEKKQWLFHLFVLRTWIAWCLLHVLITCFEQYIIIYHYIWIFGYLHICNYCICLFIYVHKFIVESSSFSLLTYKQHVIWIIYMSTTCHLDQGPPGPKCRWNTHRGRRRWIRATRRSLPRRVDFFLQNTWPPWDPWDLKIYQHHHFPRGSCGHFSPPFM